MTKRPDDTIRDGALKATIWGRDYKSDSGKTGRAFDVTIARSYKDRNGEWRETNQFSSNELLRVSRISEKALDRIDELREMWSEIRKEEKAAGREPERDR